ncbi:MAG: glycosyltransferase [Cetobacterium sp.]
MKKIIFNTDSLILGGAEKIALDYVQILSEKCEVTLLINEDNGEGNKLIDAIPKNVKYEYVISKKTIQKINEYRDKKNNIFYKVLYNYYLTKRRVEYKKNIIKILKELEYDYLFDFYCKVPVEALDNKTITFLHSSLGNLKNKKREILEEKIKVVKKVVVVSESLKNEFEKTFTNYKDKVERIYNFFDLEKINILSKEEIKKENSYILSCSRLDKNKDLFTLIKSFKSIMQGIKEDLYIVGDGPEYKNIEKFIIENNCQNRIKILGQQKNPYKWMRNCELFVHSSKKEGFGMVLVEALSFGKNIVSTNCPIGPAEILKNGKYGELIDVGDSNSMGLAIVNSLENKLRFNKKSIERATDFSKDKVEKDILNLIKE